MPEIHTAPHRVVVLGGGVAGLEALCALHVLAPDAVNVTLVEPRDDFAFAALSVREPFADPGSARFPLADVCAALDATHVRDPVAEVDAGRHQVVLDDGQRLPYDSLLVAVGANAAPAYPHGQTFRGAQDAEMLHGILQDLEGEYLHKIAFVVPPTTSWSLPLYELALLTAERAYDMELKAVEITVVTAEDSPLEILGRQASADVAAVLSAARIRVLTQHSVTSVEGTTVHAIPGDVSIDVDRVISLPSLTGPQIAGLPADAQGFLPVEEDTHVSGTDGVFAAGDGASFAVKQGGLAAQQADVAATAIARRAGVEIEQTFFHPILNAQLLTGTGSRFMRRDLVAPGDDRDGLTTSGDLPQPPHKVTTAYLGAFLERLSDDTRGGLVEAVT
jgi:sulfide:quinone oxidoreductase